jgi:hypothetical protein
VGFTQLDGLLPAVVQGGDTNQVHMGSLMDEAAAPQNAD